MAQVLDTIDNSSDWLSGRALAAQAALIAAAVGLPALCHLTGAPVRALLPMHWPVLAAGLVYGWRAGLLAGVFSPLLSFALSGMPAGASLPLMTLELAVYGGLTGFLRRGLGLRPWAALVCALAAGRLAALAAVWLALPYALSQYAAGLFTGLPAAAMQALALPALARRWAGNR